MRGVLQSGRLSPGIRMKAGFEERNNALPSSYGGDGAVEAPRLKLQVGGPSVESFKWRHLGFRNRATQVEALQGFRKMARVRSTHFWRGVGLKPGDCDLHRGGRRQWRESRAPNAQARLSRGRVLPGYGGLESAVIVTTGKALELGGYAWSAGVLGGGEAAKEDAGGAKIIQGPVGAAGFDEFAALFRGTSSRERTRASG